MSGVKRYTESCMEGGGVVPDCDGELVGWGDYAALEAERDELRAQVEAMRADTDRFQKLLLWMSSNVPEGWSEVERLGAICAYVSLEDACAYLDNLSECNVGLCEKAKP